MVLAVEKGFVFTKYLCFREPVRRYPSTFLIMLSPTMNTDVLDFWGLVEFWDGGCGLSLSLSGGQFSLFIIWLTFVFVFEDVTPVFVKCVVSSGSAWISLSTCTSFTLLFCFANFANWSSLSDWMGFEVVDIQVSRRSSFISETLSSFGLSHGLLPLHSQEFRLSSVLMTLFFSFTYSLKKPISLLSEEIWLWSLRRNSSRCPFSFVSLGSCCFTLRRIACFSCILAASS